MAALTPRSVLNRGLRIRVWHEYVSVTASATVTRAWARGEFGNGRWPCSRLSGLRVHAEFERSGDLCALVLQRGGRIVDLDVQGAELDAFLTTMLGDARPTVDSVGRALTGLVYQGPWSLAHLAYAVCDDDGIIRRVRLNLMPDTAFSYSGRASIAGRTRTGFTAYRPHAVGVLEFVTYADDRE